MIYRDRFEEWFLELNSDFTEEQLTSNGSRYFYTTTQALYDQFCRIKELENSARDSISVLDVCLT